MSSEPLSRRGPNVARRSGLSAFCLRGTRLFRTLSSKEIVMSKTSMLRAAAAVCLTLAFAAGPVQAEDGKALYREHCKSCHDAGSPNGEYTPMDMIQDQWQRFFERKYERTHKGVIDPTSNKPVTETISPADLELIKEFAIEGAADSEHPMTCG
jgi:cytochrome c5